MSGNFLMIYICNFHVLSNLLLIYICKLHWNSHIRVLPDDDRIIIKNKCSHGEDMRGLKITSNIQIAGDAVMDKYKCAGKLLLIYICNFHVLSHLLLIYICKLHWNLDMIFVCQVNYF